MNKKLVTLAVSLLLALGSYFALGTPVGDALAIAFDKDAAAAACGKLVAGPLQASDAEAVAVDPAPAP